MDKDISKGLLLRKDESSSSGNLNGMGLTSFVSKRLWSMITIVIIAPIIFAASVYAITGDDSVIAFIGIFMMSTSLSFIVAALWSRYVRQHNEICIGPRYSDEEGWQMYLDPKVIEKESNSASRLLNSLILLGIYDGVTCMTLGPVEGRYLLNVEVNDARYNLEPPPFECHGQFISIIKEHWYAAENSNEWESVHVKTDNGSANVNVRLTANDQGDLLDFKFENI